MKNFLILLLFLLLIIINPYMSAYGADSYQIVKKESKYGLIEKNTKKEILPVNYDKIRKIKYKGKTAFAGEKSSFISLYSPDGLYNNFLNDYYEANNFLQKAKFSAYPSIGAVIYKQNNKYGVILAEENLIHITKPIYAKIKYPDENSFISRLLNISFAPAEDIILYMEYNSGKRYIFQTLRELLYGDGQKFYSGCVILGSAQIDEDLNFNDGILNLAYKNISFPDSAYALTVSGETLTCLDLKNYRNIIFKNIKLSKSSANPSIVLLKDLYKAINKNSNLEIIGYPDEGFLKTGKSLYIFKNSYNRQINALCDDFELNDSDLLLNKLTGLNLSFQNGENIVAKKALKYGIIDINGNIKAPFVYDEIFPKQINYKERVKNITDITSDKLNVEYISQTEENNIFLAKKGKKYGFINDKNEVLIPFDFENYAQTAEEKQIREQINKKIDSDNKTEKRNFLISNLPMYLTYFILYPLALLLPYPFRDFYLYGVY